MNVNFTHEDKQFRDEVRTFLAKRFTTELRAAAARQAGVFAEAKLSRAWHHILYTQGWIAPSWPKEYGGTGWTAMQRYIYDQESGLAGTPMLPAMGLQMCGPVIIGYGTAAQKEFFLPPILSGEHYWCQGYSEPGAGSDLASLKTSAVRDGDDYVVNGTKIWTTHAHEANWMFLLVRTDKEGPKQAGISFLLTQMDAPGLSVTPILSMSGEHEMNQCFFDNVRIPVSQRIGEENQGWTVAKYLLEFERGGTALAGRLNAQLRRLQSIAREEIGDDGRPLWEDREFRFHFARLEAEILAVEWMELRGLVGRPAGSSAGDADASMMKLIISEAIQKLQELIMEALGPCAAVDQHHALGISPQGARIGADYAVTPAAQYLNGRAATIYGGSSEVQRNILAKVSLRL
jgi:alkylation response protein AidB-like acyl-CoA dehydrogenase